MAFIQLSMGQRPAARTCWLVFACFPMPVLVIGSYNTDLVMRCPRLPAPGETILGGTFAQHHGGKGANQAVAAAGQVHFVASLGDDEFGRQALVQLWAEGVNTAGVRVAPGQPSGVALVAAPAVQAVDTTAAGDCFTRALAVAFAEGHALPSAVAFACRAAALAVTRPSAQASLPTRAELAG
jgi:sugar/nucleoside kinase (ribokinase family)